MPRGFRDGEAKVGGVLSTGGLVVLQCSPDVGAPRKREDSVKSTPWFIREFCFWQVPKEVEASFDLSF